ncbi:hypothetical protein [Tepidiforma sp.]|uniref:hypothetical protein n=1 Tax=Tepidiforma sp. TaxID=2682230 RepID=UPI002ADE45B5|nr:hypothetical protein [Tepidiforma sp.]
MPPADLDGAFAALREVLRPYAGQLVVRADSDDELALDTRHRLPGGRLLFFGSVQKRKAYVSYHLFAVYTDPDLLDGLSAGLRRRMQGKSCFNLKAPEAELVEELRALTAAAFARYRERGYVAE